MKKALVLGAGGFIGAQMVKQLKQRHYWVRGVDLKFPEFSRSEADEFIQADLRDRKIADRVMKAPAGNPGPFDEVYQFAAEMGGAGYIFTGENDTDVMCNSAQININVAEYATIHKVKKLLFASSACVYNEILQTSYENPGLTEESAYPANPDSNYGWEKLFSERVYQSFQKNKGLHVKIARFHNIMGEESCYNNGREKAPAALCRKVAEAKDGDTIEVWGNGNQSRSFLYIDECLEGIFKFMDSDFMGPVNIGSSELISINELARMIMRISGKSLTIKNVEGPIGVSGRSSDNKLIMSKLGWQPSKPLVEGVTALYKWVNGQVNAGSFHL
jgi:GDP-D-mannose 3', 5'-epimerase